MGGDTTKKTRYRRTLYELQRAKAVAEGRCVSRDAPEVYARLKEKRRLARVQAAGEEPKVDKELANMPIPRLLSKLNPDQMTREEIMTIIPLLEAYNESQEQREIERIELQEYQIPFFASLKKQRTISGGNQAAKTFSAILDLSYYIHRNHPYRPVPDYPLHCRYCTVDYELFDTVIHPYFRRIWDHRILRGGRWPRAVVKRQGEIHRIALADGGFVECKTYKQDVSSYQAGQFDWIAMDEPCPFEEMYTENWMRTVTRNGCLINVFTVWGRYGSITWEQKLLDRAEDPETEHLYDFFEFSLLDNKYVSEESKQQIIAGLSLEEYDARVLGKAVRASDRVYHRFSRNNIVTDFAVPNTWPRIVILDPHDDKAHAVDWYAVDPDDRIYCYRAIKRKATVPELVKEIRVLTAGEPVALWLVDPSSEHQAANRALRDKSLKFQFMQAGLTHLINGQVRDKEANILKVNELLTPDPVSGKPRLNFFESLRTNPADKENWGPLNEIEKYIYVTTSTSARSSFAKRTRDRHDDHMVNLRMLAAADPRYSELVPLHDNLRQPQKISWVDDQPEDNFFHTQTFPRPILGDYD